MGLSSRLCLTGGERGLPALAARLAAHPGMLQEVRLDLLDRIEDEVFPLLGSLEVIATCRGREEGGSFAGSEEERARVLERALAVGPGYLDLELATPRATRELLCAKARASGSTRLILSSHCCGLAEGRDRAAELAAEPGFDLLKLAVALEDPSELARLRGLLREDPRPVLRIGMGPAGLLSRALPDRFGSPWSYLVAEGAEPVAPGQLDLTRARAWRLPEAERLVPIALLGGEQVLRSPGPTIYNRFFATRGLPYLYLPVPASRPAPTLELLEELGFAGVSVTMPFKETLSGEVGSLDAAARAAGALNTIVLEPGIRGTPARGPRGRRGLNTDLGAIQRLLAAQAGSEALVLGAGGAARAAIVALRALGCPVAVSARRLEQASMLVALGASPVPWEARGELPFSILVNATPCGADGRSDPLPTEVSLAGRTVLDLVVASPIGSASTPLVARARAAGAITRDGLEMWLEQGALQLAAIAGLGCTPAELRGCLDA